jgi:magnesium transporter
MTQAQHKYRMDSAGRQLAANVPVVHSGATVEEVFSQLGLQSKDLETINYVYVLDSHKHLVGVVSIKELFRATKRTKVSDLAEKKLVVLRPHSDRERAALLAIKHNLKAIPVVDSDGIFLGAIPADRILDILHQENIEDVLRSAGIHHLKHPEQDLLKSSARTYYHKRLPWLVVGLLGGLLAAVIARYFEHLISQMLTLAFFIPMVVYMSDAVGSQAQTIFILSLNRGNDFNLRKYIRREVRVSIWLALTLSVLIAFLSYWWLADGLLSLILASSVLATTLAATVIAVFLPWLIVRFNGDPAVASGPFATVLRDVLSIVIYFAISGLFIGWFG